MPRSWSRSSEESELPITRASSPSKEDESTKRVPVIIITLLLLLGGGLAIQRLFANNEQAPVGDVNKDTRIPKLEEKARNDTVSTVPAEKSPEQLGMDKRATIATEEKSNDKKVAHEVPATSQVQRDEEKAANIAKEAKQKERKLNEIKLLAAKQKKAADAKAAREQRVLAERERRRVAQKEKDELERAKQAELAQARKRNEDLATWERVERERVEREHEEREREEFENFEHPEDPAEKPKKAAAGGVVVVDRHKLIKRGPAAKDSVKVFFVNKLQEEVQVYWLNQNTRVERASTASIAPGKSVSLKSFKTHEFVVRRVRDNVVVAGEFTVSTPPGSTQIFKIRDEF